MSCCCCPYSLFAAISVWCETASSSFGEVLIPASIDASLATTAEGPPLKCTTPTTTVALGNFTTRAHNVQGEVKVLSKSVLEISGFVYDGLGPAAYFWIDDSAVPSAAGERLYDSRPTGACGMTPLVGADGTTTYRVEFPEGSSILDFLGGCKCVRTQFHLFCSSSLYPASD